MNGVTMTLSTANGSTPRTWACVVEHETAGKKELSGPAGDMPPHLAELEAVKAGLLILKAACTITVASQNETVIRLLDDPARLYTPAIQLALEEIRDLKRTGGHRFRLLKLYRDGLPPAPDNGRALAVAEESG